MKKRKRRTSKIVKLMEVQTPEQLDALSATIESVMRDMLSTTIRFHIKKHGWALEHSLGMSQEDLLSEIRVEIWKACLLHNPGRKASFKTYAKLLIQNRVKVLLNRARCQKNTFLEYGMEELAA